jgi:5'-deoxy-5'-methylthioadenosine phosphorylase
MTQAALGVIAGTGFYDLPELNGRESLTVDTPYGAAQYVTGFLHGRKTIFLSRHGVGHETPPHRVNYRANIAALEELGVSEILAINVVGGLGPDSGDLVVVDDFIDFTKSRVNTFFDGTTSRGVVHADMGEPFDQRLRQAWINACSKAQVPVITTGVYGAFEGPRFETRAEIRAAMGMGVTVAGMTVVPEVVLANELGIPYACISLVVNPATGLGAKPVTIEDINVVIEQGSETLRRVLSHAANSLVSVQDWEAKQA